MGATLETLPLRSKYTLDTLVRLRPHLKQCIARTSSSSDTLARSSQYTVFFQCVSIARTSSTFVHINCIGSHAAHLKHTRAGQRAQCQTLHNTCSTHCTDLKQGADTSLQVVAKFPRTDHTRLHLLAHKYVDAHTHKNTQIHNQTNTPLEARKYTKYNFAP